MADNRTCEQCGAVFVPRREHARFCGVRCRVTWNREHAGDPAAGAERRTFGETLGRTAAFLRLAAANARSITIAGAHAGR